ncbi:MAG TPA: hypothetical protein VHC73_05935 [Vitreimonas sp.]|nr:hypothetical protein [Vitreimonas sp.]
MSCEVPDNMREAGRRYTVRMLGTGLLYMAVVFAAVWVIRHSGLQLPQWTVVLISLTPVIPALVMMRVYLTFVRQMDEFNRRIQSEAWLISAGLVGFGTFTYSFLEEWAHFPRLDLVWVFPALIGMWGLATFFVKRRYQ